jgi:hypothetical protein
MRNVVRQLRLSPALDYVRRYMQSPIDDDVAIATHIWVPPGARLEGIW